MMKRSTTSIVLMLIATALATKMLTGQNPETAQAQREAMYYRYLEFASYVKGGSILPHWMSDGSSFWYAEGAPEHLGLGMEGVAPDGLNVHPDGRRVAFTAGRPRRNEVWVLKNFLPVPKTSR